MAKGKEGQLLSSVKHAMQILRLFKLNQNELGVTEIANKLDLPKGTAHRLIKTLTRENFLTKNPRTNRYRLGLSLLTLGGVISVHTEIYQEALPLLQSLVHTLKETAHICLLEKTEVVYLLRVENQATVPLVTRIGRRNPVHCTSEGLVILAYQHEDRINQLLTTPLYPYTLKTITDPDKLKLELEKIRERGYSLTVDHFYEGFVSIAVPIRDYTEEVVSSLAVIGPTSRITESDYPIFIEQIKKVAEQISELLGYYKEDTSF